MEEHGTIERNTIDVWIERGCKTTKPPASQEAGITVDFDECLNEIGWDMHSFLINNGAKFDGRVFNNMKSFLHGAISKYLASKSALLAQHGAA